MNSVLVSAVIRRVEARPKKFHHFMDLLKDSDEILRKLGRKMEATYSELHMYMYCRVCIHRRSSAIGIGRAGGAREARAEILNAY